MANTSLTLVKTWSAAGGSDDTSSTVVQWPGGVGQMVVKTTAGIFGGAETARVKFEMSPDDETTWVAIGGDSTLAADGCVNFDLNACDIRLTLSGSDGYFTLKGYLTETIKDGVWGKGIMHCPN
tara:strand:+ start:8766 stop:9137 length:372 start_codon:yes stop_codon:yes gene_type:complete